MTLNMKLQTLAPVLALALALLNTACSMETVSSKDVKGDAVHQSYSVNYAELGNQTTYFAQFRVGGGTGTTIDLDSPASLRINNREPSKSTLFGTSYKMKDGGFVPSAQFEFTTPEGQVLVNSISFDAVHVLNAGSTVSVTRPYAVAIQASALGPNERISVEIAQTSKDAQGKMVYISARGVYGGGSQAVFSPAELNQLNNGVATLRVTRSRSSGLTSATREGGGISATYEARPLSVTIVDKVGSSVPVAPLAQN